MFCNLGHSYLTRQRQIHSPRKVSFRKVSFRTVACHQAAGQIVKKYFEEVHF